MKHLDKWKHFTYSFTLAVVASFFVGVFGGIAIAAGLGVAKESWDAHKGRWCWWDMAANGVGLGVAVFIMRGWGL